MDPIMDPIMDNCGTWSPIHDWIHNWRSVNCLIAWIVNDHLNCQGPFTMRPACSPRETSMCEKTIANRRTTLWTTSALETVTTSLPSPGRPTRPARLSPIATNNLCLHCYRTSRMQCEVSHITSAMRIRGGTYESYETVMGVFISHCPSGRQVV